MPPSVPSSVPAIVVETATAVFRLKVRPEDNVLDLAVDSFLIVDYCTRLEERLGQSIDLDELLAAESLAEYGALLEARAAQDTPA